MENQKLLNRPSVFDGYIFNCPSAIDRSREKLRLIALESQLIEERRDLQRRLDSIDCQLYNTRDRLESIDITPKLYKF